ncbi:hypothetical protein ATE84_2418 [Aquimarina sp. MAR_2010_214]|uniref:hypothetical protein n=1 Tax=Aquimarina sp. MAR_2010_214 TaxID=1250026 RepID=UPI000CB7B633|nr:hypothetical protein [Aquimarina sp. MAR_2010_214]PKV50361.1 hypothetical protein ATE84_2418 [Aquimarina sp. MAR_2010_214]
MKKIVLTLGIFLSAYATYAMNSSDQKNTEDSWPCTKDIYIYDDEGRLMTIEHDRPC